MSQTTAGGSGSSPGSATLRDRESGASVASASFGTNDTNLSADADGDSNGGSGGGVGGASTLDVSKLLGNKAEADDTAIQEVFSLKQINIMIKMFNKVQARDGGVTKTNFASFLRAATEKAKVVAGKNAEDFWAYVDFNHLFDLLDHNKDGVLTKREFIDNCRLIQEEFHSFDKVFNGRPYFWEHPTFFKNKELYNDRSFTYNTAAHMMKASINQEAIKLGRYHKKHWAVYDFYNSSTWFYVRWLAVFCHTLFAVFEPPRRGLAPWVVGDSDTIARAEAIPLIFYLIDIGLKWYALGGRSMFGIRPKAHYEKLARREERGYFAVVNRLTVLFVTVMLVDWVLAVSGATAIRFSRVLRPILAILYHTELRSLIQTVIKSLPQVWYISVILGVVLIVYACIGVQLFAFGNAADTYRVPCSPDGWNATSGISGNATMAGINATATPFTALPQPSGYQYPECVDDPTALRPLEGNFEWFPEAMVTLFIMLSAENFPGISHPALDITPVYALFFVSFLVVATFILLQVLTATIFQAYSANMELALVEQKRRELKGYVAAYQVMSLYGRASRGADPRVLHAVDAATAATKITRTHRATLGDGWAGLVDSDRLPTEESGSSSQMVGSTRATRLSSSSSEFSEQEEASGSISTVSGDNVPSERVSSGALLLESGAGTINREVLEAARTMLDQEGDQSLKSEDMMSVYSYESYSRKGGGGEAVSTPVGGLSIESVNVLILKLKEMRVIPRSADVRRIWYRELCDRQKANARAVVTGQAPISLDNFVVLGDALILARQQQGLWSRLTGPILVLLRESCCHCACRCGAPVPMVEEGPFEVVSRAETERSVQSDMGTGRVLARRIADSVVFRTMVGIMILINVSALACFHRNIDDSFAAALDLVDNITLGLFFVEMVFKIYAYGFRSYWKNGWNRLDAYVVFGSLFALALYGVATLFDDTPYFALRFMRSVSLLRTLKIIQIVDGFKPIVLTLVGIRGLVVRLITVVLIFMYVYAIIGMELYAGKFASTFVGVGTRFAHFDNFLWAMLALFQLYTTSNWHELLYHGMRTDIAWWSVLYFVSYFFFLSMIVSNVLVAIVWEVFAVERESAQERLEGTHRARVLSIIQENRRNLKGLVTELEAQHERNSNRRWQEKMLRSEDMERRRVEMSRNVINELAADALVGKHMVFADALTDVHTRLARLHKIVAHIRKKPSLAQTPMDGRMAAQMEHATDMLHDVERIVVASGFQAKAHAANSSKVIAIRPRRKVKRHIRRLHSDRTATASTTPSGSGDFGDEGPTLSTSGDGIASTVSTVSGAGSALSAVSGAASDASAGASSFSDARPGGSNRTRAHGLRRGGRRDHPVSSVASGTTESEGRSGSHSSLMSLSSGGLVSSAVSASGVGSSNVSSSLGRSSVSTSLSATSVVESGHLASSGRVDSGPDRDGEFADSLDALPDVAVDDLVEIQQYLRELDQAKRGLRESSTVAIPSSLVAGGGGGGGASGGGAAFRKADREFARLTGFSGLGVTRTYRPGDSDSNSSNSGGSGSGIGSYGSQSSSSSC